LRRSSIKWESAKSVSFNHSLAWITDINNESTVTAFHKHLTSDKMINTSNHSFRWQLRNESVWKSPKE
jgi:hypothetical protein